MSLSYQILDVFTDRPLAGNPLAIVHGADGLSEERMQAIAREFNLSETVFLQTPQSAGNLARLRIFTPAVELPFAGHPTIGTAVALGLARKASALRLEERVGLITALFERLDRRTGEARFSLPQMPERCGQAPELRDIAIMLGIEAAEIGCAGYKADAFSAGNPFYLIPVRGPEVLARLVPQLGPRWREVFPLGRHSVYVFTATPGETDNDFAARMFSPDMGMAEDPGTGSAAAALIGLLSEQMDDGQAEYSLRQGLEIGRPCRIMLHMRAERGRLSHAAIGGRAVVIGEGRLDVD